MWRGPKTRYLVSLALLACLSGCSNKTAQAPQTSLLNRSARLPIDPGVTGSVRGTISFVGDPPRPAPIDMSPDPACKVNGSVPALSESLVVSQGRLSNAFVYVKDDLGKYVTPKPSQPVVLDQIGCRYEPHVLGIVAGQTLRVLNSDATGHNVHPVSQRNEQWNDSQEPHGPPIEHTFSAPELMLPLVCNKHPWMKMYVNVVDNRFFAVTDARGDFEISGLPPGSYTLEAVHEKLGVRQVKVTVPPRGISNVKLSFSQ